MKMVGVQDRLHKHFIRQISSHLHRSKDLVNKLSTGDVDTVCKCNENMIYRTIFCRDKSNN